ncbi:hypothetical protein ACNKHW_18585 [Shigella flexneri]
MNSRGKPREAGTTGGDAGKLNSILRTGPPPLVEVLPSVYNRSGGYRDYTLRQLCQEMHSLYVSFDVKDLQSGCSASRVPVSGDEPPRCA